ncbi:MAG: EAL domain-containing protein [Gemmatimonadota bacterium]
MRFRGAVIITSSVDGRVLETASRVGKALGLDLRGILPKPASPEKQLQLLGAARRAEAPATEQQPQYAMASCLRPDFPDQLNAAIKRSGLERPNLILEVTESRALDDTLAAYDIFTRIRLNRISLSIDDFGTGHSSLAQLRDVPFNELKVDQSFVKGAAADPTRRAILDASLTMAQKLGMRTVGEGVETLDDWALLHGLGCAAGQGFLIAEPMPGEQLISWIADWDDRRDSLMRELAARA